MQEKPDEADAHNDRGVALRQKGKLREAIAEYRAAIRIKPDHALAHNNLGAALQAQWKVKEAIAEYRTAIRIKPELALAHFNLGRVLKAQWKRAEAAAELRLAHDSAQPSSELAAKIERELAETERHRWWMLWVPGNRRNGPQ